MTLFSARHIVLSSALVMMTMPVGSAFSQPLPIGDRHPTIVLAQSSVLETVDQIAQQITVRIDSLKSGNGSGVIVAKQGSTYSVLTAEHVVPKPDEYAIIAPDGQRYPVSFGSIKTLEGVDLAVLQFSSLASYSVATLASYYIDLEDRPLVFLSGFAGTGRSAARQLTVGKVFPTGTTLFDAQKCLFNGQRTRTGLHSLLSAGNERRTGLKSARFVSLAFTMRRKRS